MEELTYIQYAARHGLVTDYDVQSHIHGGLMAAHMPNSYHRRYKKRLAELQEERAKGISKYREAISRGEIVEPRKRGLMEEMKEKAKGHPDLASVQAARRLCEKRNIRWWEP